MKTSLIFLATLVLGLLLISYSLNKNSSPYGVEDVNMSEPRIDFILGSWTGTGFVTDIHGLQQYVEVQEDNIKLPAGGYQIVGVGKNPANRFTHTYTKSMSFSNKMNAWYIKGEVNRDILQDSKISFGQNNVFLYSYYDSKSSLMRYITTRDTEDSFTETQEKWEPEGWCKIAWFRLIRREGFKSSTSSILD